jgi:glutathione S-transferase
VARSTVELHQFPPFWGLPNGSPFCLKLETWLRLADVPYESRYAHAPQKGPKKKMPYVVVDGDVIGDSNLIIEELKRRFEVDPDAELTREQRARAVMLQALMEDHLYWAFAWGVFVDDAGWVHSRAMFDDLPLSPLVSKIVRRAIRKQIWTTGMGRHTPAEITGFARRALDALSDALGDQPYLLGDQPATIDATGYGFVTLCIKPPIESPMFEHARSLDNLAAYQDRLEQAYWKEAPGTDA